MLGRSLTQRLRADRSWVDGNVPAGYPAATSDNHPGVNMRQVNVNVVMISQASSEHSICFAVKSDQGQKAIDKLNETFSREIGLGEIRTIQEVPNQSILAAVGQGMCMTPGVSAILFSALAKANVNITAIAQGCSEYNITVVVDKVSQSDLHPHCIVLAGGVETRSRVSRRCRWARLSVCKTRWGRIRDLLKWMGWDGMGCRTTR